MKQIAFVFKVVLDDIDIFSEYLAIYEKEDLKPKLRIIPLRNTKDHYTIEVQIALLPFLLTYKLNIYVFIEQ